MAELKGRCILLADIAIIENTLMEQKMKELTLGALRKQHGRVIHRESGWKYFRNDGLHLRMKAEQEALGLERQESEQSQPSEHLPSSGLPRGDQMPMEIWTNPRGKLYNGFEKVLRSVDGNPEQTPKTADQLAVIEKYSTWRDGQCGCTIDWSAARQSS
ncbi:Fc.00g014080.m01.CDS01 [Cosmosporella sp. VM-42]